MAGQTFIQQNQIPNEVELKDLLALHRKQLLLNLNCHHVAMVDSFDPDTQLSTVKLVYKKTIFQPNAVTGGYDPVLYDYPPIVDCPTIILGGGPAALTFPVQKGDECLVFFNDRDIDNWYSGAANGPVATPRLHSFADAIVLVGLRSLANALTDYDTDRAVLRLGNARVTVGAAAATVEFGDETNTTSIVAEADDITLAVGTTVFKLTRTGKFSVTNSTGEFVAALITFLQTATAGGYPIVGDLTTLQSFKA